jgi:hypothetical protein
MGAIERNPTAFQSLFMPNKQADYSFDIGKPRPKQDEIVNKTPID